MSRIIGALQLRAVDSPRCYCGVLQNRNSLPHACFPGSLLCGALQWPCLPPPPCRAPADPVPVATLKRGFPEGTLGLGSGCLVCWFLLALVAVLRCHL